LKPNHHYKVYAEKERDGYPDMMLGMYNPKDDASVALATSEAAVVGTTDLIMEISARGYRDWYYGEALDKSTAVSLRILPGEEKTLQVRLQPSAK
jgi:hypothetical protein